MPLLVVSIDGADWKDWGIISSVLSLSEPSFAVKNVEGTFPTDTYPSHVSIMTGTWPKHHGVIANVKDDSGCWNREHSIIKSETILQRAKKSGLKVASISWPVTLGLDIDILFPEIWPPMDRVGQIKAYRENIRGIDDFLNANIDSLSSFAGRDLDTFSANLAIDILEKQRPDLIFLHFAALDCKKHNCDCSRDTLDDAYDFMAGLLRRIIASSSGYDCIFLSDHSQRPCERKFSIEAASKQIGLNACFTTEPYGLYSYIYTDNEEETLKCIEKIKSEFPDAIGEVVSKRDAEKRWNIDGRYSFILESGEGIYLTKGDDIYSTIKKNTFSQSAHGYFPEKGPYAFLAAYCKGLKGSMDEKSSIINIAPTIASILNLEFYADGKSLI